MAKKKAKKPKVPQGVLPGVLAVDMSAPAEMRTVKKTQELVSNYTLDDGSIIHVKPMLLDVRRATNQYNEKGQPVYFVKFGLAITTTVPKRLHKGVRRSSRKKK